MSAEGSKSYSVADTEGYSLLNEEDTVRNVKIRKIGGDNLSSSTQNLNRSLSSDERAGKDNADTETVPPVGHFTLFRYSSLWDKFLMSTASLVAIASGALWPAVMVLFGSFLDNFIYQETKLNGTFASQNESRLNTTEFFTNAANLCLYNTLLGVVILVFNYIIVSSFSLCAANQAYKIKCLFMASILKQDISWFDTNKTGDFSNCLSSDLNKILDGMGEKVGICISFLSTTVLCTACGMYYGWKLALVTMAVTPLLTIAMAILSKVQATVSAEESKAYGAAGAVAAEAFSAIHTVFAFGGEQKEIERYLKCLEPARRKGIKRGLMTSFGSGLTWCSIFVGYALAFWYGVKLIIQDKDKPNPEYTAGTLIIVFSNIVTGSMFIGQTAPFFEAFALARGAAGKIFSVIERKPNVDSSSNMGEKPLNLDGKIILEDVHFSYPSRPDVQVLKGISLTIQPGEMVALVGSSGCGKSTIVQLILRFYDITDGCVKIDEKDVKVLNVGWLRSNIGFVGQEPVLFSTTIAENIQYGKKKATQEDIEKSAKLANVHDFISSLPLKYDTHVGDLVTQLSGGQKQRIAVARALIKDPKILLLDEATSALDTESEAIVQTALDKARLGRTIIIVAHRLSTVKNADRICVISDGVIKEMGKHKELMEKKELYYKLVLSQINEISSLKTTVPGSNPEFSRNISIQSSKSQESYDSNHSIYDPCVSFSSSLNDVELHYNFKDEGNKHTSPLWKRLLHVSLPEWPFLSIGAISSLVMGLHTPIYGVIFGAILGVLAEEKDKMLEDNSYYCLIFLVMGGTSFIAAFLQVFMFSVAAERLTSRLRSKVFIKLISQDISWFDNPKNSTGALCSKLTSDASDMQGATGSRISVLFQAASTFIACVALVVYYNYKIGCLVFVFVPLILFSIALEGRVSGGHLLTDKTSTEAASKVATEALENIRTVASLHQENAFYQQFCKAMFKTYKFARTRSHIRGLTFAFSQAMNVFAYSAAFYYGSILVASGEMKYPDLYKVLEGIVVSTSMLGQTVAFTPDFQKAKLAAARIFELLDLKTGTDVFSNEGKHLNNIEGSVTFQKVHFMYPSRPTVKVLDCLDLHINSGKTLALVGSSGCGKSTCLQLIEHFYNVESGAVLIDDVNVKQLNVRNLRSHIGLVSQEPILFSYSIAENIAYGKNFSTVTMNEIVDVARKANIHNFITSLPQGYDTAVGLKGTQLSGGQKQRVAIARALLRDPKILLLDEATSALDTESERIVQKALDNAMNGRTCLIIAHRLTTIQNADSIAVIHNGKIVEHGSHQYLLELKGHYYKLYQNQL